MRFFSALLFLILFLHACATTSDYPTSGKVYMRGRGIAKYHLYDGVNKCKTAFGLDPDAFDMRVTAASMRITEKFPKMGKVGKRGGPYDHTAKCIFVRSLENQKTVMVRAIDKCCGGSLNSEKTHQLDLAKEAFEELAPAAQGNIRIEWKVVDCPEPLQVEGDSDVCDDNYYFSR